MTADEILRQIARLDARKKLDKIAADDCCKISVKLTDGNAYAILGVCRGRARGRHCADSRPRVDRKDRWSNEMWNLFLEEATAGNYDHLLMTTMRYFNVD